MRSEDANTVLLASVRALTWPVNGLDIEREGRAALASWIERRHALVIADFGALADGLTGPRLARAIRTRCQTTQICLMSDDPREEQRQWARAQGADEMIQRTREAILERLPSHVTEHAVAWVPGESSPVENMQVLADRVARELNTAGLGPAATLAVDDALRGLLARRRGIPPDARTVACEVGMEITDLAARQRFLRKFGVE